MIKKIWELAGSVHAVIPVLIVITLVSVAGVLVPQDQPVAAYQQNMAGLRALVFLGLGLNHVFSTWWFYALLGLLALNIVACSVSHQVKNLKAASGLHPLASREKVATLMCSAEFPTRISAPGAARDVSRYFRQRFFSCVTKQDGNGFQVAAGTRGIRESGSIIFHISILFFLIGGIAGLSGGFSYVRELYKGEVVPIRGSGMLLRCDWFKVERNGDGAVSAYKSKLDVLGGDYATLAEKVIAVNHPLTCRGIRFYQNSYGQQSDAFEDAKLLVAGAGLGRPAESGYAADFPFDSAVTLPGGAVLTIPRFVCDFVIDMETREVSSRSDKPRNPAAQVVIVKAGDTVFNAWTFVNFPGLLQDGKSGCTVRFQSYTPRYYTGITIARNPGSPFIWLGFALATLGIVMVFYFPRKNFWVFAVPDGEKGAKISVGGASARPLSSFQVEFADTIESLKRLFKQGAES